MPQSFIRPVALVALSLAAASVACSADQNRTSNTAANEPSLTSSPPLADTTPKPSIAPETMPPPAAQSDADRSSNNQLGATGAGTPLPKPQLSQSQIAMVTELANSAEIEQGKLAQGKAKSPAVKKFAAMMVKHHTEAKNDQAKLYKQLSLTPTQSQQATALKEDADTTLGSLKAANGTGFDVAYIDSQVDAHQKVLASINEDLLPAAADQQLIDGLNKMKTTVEAHLNEAKTIQADLLKTGSAASNSGTVSAGTSTKTTVQGASGNDASR